MKNRRSFRCSRDAEANDMIHMRSDHRSVMAQFVIPAPQKKDSQKGYTKWRNNSTTESIKFQLNERMRSEEANRSEERCCELDRRIKQKAEAAVAAHKPSEDETAAGMKQAEGGADANATASHNLVEEETAAAMQDTEGETKTDSTVAATETKREEVNSTASTLEKK